MRNQKKIDVWNITHDGQTIAVTIYIVRAATGTGTSNPTFLAECKEHSIRAQDSDISRLRVAVDAEIKTTLSLEYGEFLIVKYGGFGRADDPIFSDSYEHGGHAYAQSKIDVEKIWLTTDTKNDGPGNRIERVAKKNPTFPPRGLSLTLGKDVRGDGNALIASTPANRRALSRIFAGFSELNKQLETLLDQESIAEHLEMLAQPGARLLGSGPAESAELED